MYAVSPLTALARCPVRLRADWKATATSTGTLGFRSLRVPKIKNGGMTVPFVPPRPNNTALSRRSSLHRISPQNGALFNIAQFTKNLCCTSRLVATGKVQANTCFRSACPPPHPLAPLIIFDTARRSRAPSIPRLCRLFSLESRCGSWRWLALPHANVFLPAETTPHLRLEFLQ